MSAIYTRAQWDALSSTHYDAVASYVTEHPSTSIEAIASALSIPYEVAFQCCMESDMVVLPNTAGELQFSGGTKGRGPSKL